MCSVMEFCNIHRASSVLSKSSLKSVFSLFNLCDIFEQPIQQSINTLHQKDLRGKDTQGYLKKEASNFVHPL